MIDVNGILNALQSPGGRNTAMIGGGAALAGLAGGALMGKKGRKLVGSAAKYGAVAALGGLAYHAFTKRNGAQQPAPSQTPGHAQTQTSVQTQQTAPALGAPDPAAFIPATDDQAAMERRGRSLLRAMIAAVKADGAVSHEEQVKLSERMQTMQLDAESRAFVEFELARPLNLDEVTANVEGVEHAAEIYAASLAAIDAEGAVEKAYLKMLAARLRLEDDLVAALHAAADEEQAAPPPGIGSGAAGLSLTA
jgi:uncharacterized membrane protein YebE (DUF533 family)